MEMRIRNTYFVILSVNKIFMSKLHISKHIL